MGDYVAGFLGSSEGCNWNMDAFDVSTAALATWSA
jgi:linoleate 10R-lipoxygenase